MSDMPKSAAMPERRPDLTASDPYRVLGVLPTATQADIKQAYFVLIRQYPPETEGENFKLIRAAYEKIKSAQRRVETDIFLPQPPPAWQPPPTALTLDTAFHPQDALLALRRWGELGRANFEADFREIDL
ncbi:MAG: DnaJ domain-containing protein [Anaerolineae bacterium]|nr:DnaJ domain-containing protein [Anaerolineae bacterium]